MQEMWRENEVLGAVPSRPLLLLPKLHGTVKSQHSSEAERENGACCHVPCQAEKPEGLAHAST